MKCEHRGKLMYIKWGKKRERIPVFFCYKCDKMYRIEFGFLRGISENGMGRN